MLPDGFLAFINEHQLFTKTDRLLVAVSGGLDSMVLAALLHQGGFSFGVAHVNFGLREDASDADAAFVQNMALSYGVPFHLTRFDTVAEAAHRRESIQVTARQLRYEWFRHLQLQHGYVALTTAHHLNDVLETVLLNLSRGTGLAGLRGMPIQSELTDTRPRVVRPLWFATRAAIEAYAQIQAIQWREDASNESDNYSRNQIRHHVVPVLETINPGLMQTLPRSLSQLRAAEAILQQDLDASFHQCTKPTDEGFIIDLNALMRHSEPLFRLGEWLRPFGFTPDVLAQCWAAVSRAGNVPGRNGQVFLALAHRLLHDRGKLWLLPRESVPNLPLQLTDWPISLLKVSTAGDLSVEVISVDEWDGRWPADSSVALLDADALPFPWVLRPWREGDRFSPLGMTGTRLISDVLADAKLPIRQRERVWVLEADGQIMWLVGLRVAQASRITRATRRIAVLHWQSGRFSL
ncbi:tRNA lysidine(34) synthetase TilS [uncultured Fibrella sp.]|uniref:tRNA lysidine(34) synthetase TilS n=1 Tax=uncultured Fibrella sp. TaxID=1284596 RepID=UPI0035CA8C32